MSQEVVSARTVRRVENKLLRVLAVIEERQRVIERDLEAIRKYTAVIAKHSKVPHVPVAMPSLQAGTWGNSGGSHEPSAAVAAHKRSAGDRSKALPEPGVESPSVERCARRPA
jgi:hypothetical protein